MVERPNLSFAIRLCNKRSIFAFATAPPLNCTSIEER